MEETHCQQPCKHSRSPRAPRIKSASLKGTGAIRRVSCNLKGDWFLPQFPYRPSAPFTGPPYGGLFSTAKLSVAVPGFELHRSAGASKNVDHGRGLDFVFFFLSLFLSLQIFVATELKASLALAQCTMRLFSDSAAIVAQGRSVPNLKALGSWEICCEVCDNAGKAGPTTGSRIGVDRQIVWWTDRRCEASWALLCQ